MTYQSVSSDRSTENLATSYLRQEYEAQRALFDTQPAMTRRFFEAQAQRLAEAILQNTPSAHVTLPDQLITQAGCLTSKPASVPPEQREQKIGGLKERLTHSEMSDIVRARLKELEQTSQPAVALSIGLLRYATARHMVGNMLPAGRSVAYIAPEGEEIPALPDSGQPEVASAITTAADAIAEEGPAEAGRGELHVPYVPFARRFYLPQWVAFGAEGELLVNSVQEAEAHLGSMQRFLGVLHAAVGLTAYIVADEDYQTKRYGMLGQLVNQGRALARYQTREIIRTIQRRVQAHELNRGLSISLPYLDDQHLMLKSYPIVIIPAGRIMFVPAFVARAAREEAAKVAQDTRLSPSTRKYLLRELALLEQAFITAD